MILVQELEFDYGEEEKDDFGQYGGHGLSTIDRQKNLKTRMAEELGKEIGKLVEVSDCCACRAGRLVLGGL
eukprot:scaffold5380_cov131-Cylindrotheca_fusiformis.AAC.8